MNDPIRTFRTVLAERLSRFPDSPFFAFAERELSLIDDRWQSDLAVDRGFYDSLNLGLMCARELEQSDPTFCNAAFAMLEHIRLSVRSG